MQTIMLTTLLIKNSLSIIKLQRYLKIIITSPSFQVWPTEEISSLEKNKLEGDSKNVVL